MENQPSYPVITNFHLKKANVLLAVQQSYKENNGDGFGLLEGSVKYDTNTRQYIFTPCEDLKKLFDMVEQTEYTCLMETLSKRIAKILLSEIDYLEEK